MEGREKCRVELIEKRRGEWVCSTVVFDKTVFRSVTKYKGEGGNSIEKKLKKKKVSSLLR